MAVQKKFTPQIKIYSYEDMSRAWFILFRDANGKRVKKQGSVNSHKTYRSRMKAIMELKEEYEKKYTQLNGIMAEVEEWLMKNKGRWRPKSYKTIWSKVNGLNAWLDGRPVTKENIQLFFEHIRCTKEGATYHAYKQKLSQLFKGIKKGHLFEDIPTFRYTSTPDRYFQDYEVKALKKDILEHQPHLWFFVQLMANVFLRPKEIRFMKVADFMLQDRKVRIRKEVSKNEKTEYVPILPNFLPVLIQELQGMHPDEYLFQGVFSGDQNKPIGENTMYNRHVVVLKRLRFPVGYTLYSWRHTGAVRAVMDGISLLALSRMMRHHNTAQTEQYLRQLGVFDFLEEIQKYRGI